MSWVICIASYTYPYYCALPFEQDLFVYVSVLSRRLQVFYTGAFVFIRES